MRPVPSSLIWAPVTSVPGKRLVDQGVEDVGVGVQLGHTRAPLVVDPEHHGPGQLEGVVGEHVPDDAVDVIDAGHVHRAGGVIEPAGVADLPAATRVERRAVEHDSPGRRIEDRRLVLVEVRELVAQIHGHDDEPTDAAARRTFCQASVAPRRRCVYRRTQCRPASSSWPRGREPNLQAVLDACADGRLPAEVVAVVSDHAGAGALARAGRAGVPAVHVGRQQDEPRPDYDARLADVVAGFGPDFVVLAGWMRILTMSFLGWFPDRVVNLHPALPGELPGTHAIERAWHEALAGERTQTGVMVHLVPSESVDDGPVLASAVVPILPDDTLDSLTARVHRTEHELLVNTLSSLCRQEALQ